MTARPSSFDAIVDATIADRELQQWLGDYQSIQQDWHDAAVAELGDAGAWRDEVARIRRHTVAHLDSYVAQFADNVEAAGGRVFFAATAAEARDHVAAIVRDKGVRRVVKVKSMVSDEIGLNPALESMGVDVAETDLGEFILQLSGERPYHLIGPAVHKRLPEIQALFSAAAGEALPDDPDQLAAFARAHLREKFLKADIGISGANVGIASTGTVVLVTNEGNGRMSTTLPPVHIVVMGMERLVPDWPSLAPVLTMLTRAGTGERATAYFTAITGPRRSDDVDGPEELHVVIVDNGRSRLLGTEYQNALTCIRCGCCADFCPVYGTIGGHAYESTYVGPIGAVLTPLLSGLDGRQHLPFASSLCGACDAACPARVPLTDLLLALRADVSQRQSRAAPWAAGFAGFAALTEWPRLWQAALSSAGAAWPAVGRLPRLTRRLVSAWAVSRELPSVAPRSFHKLWAARRGSDAARHDTDAGRGPRPGRAETDYARRSAPVGRVPPAHCYRSWTDRVPRPRASSRWAERIRVEVGRRWRRGT